MIFVGRALLGLVAARLGAARVLAWAVASVPAGALLVLSLAMCGVYWLTLRTGE